MGEDGPREGTPEGGPIASRRLKALIAGLSSLFGEEETLRMLSDTLKAEEIRRAAKGHTLEEIEAAIADARAAGAARWAWVAKRLEEGPVG